jgi:dihydroneopterin aldolase/2-amino-4-hydroxy-6-hydroxymethyldihydropteridine diphosphokinase
MSSMTIKITPTSTTLHSERVTAFIAVGSNIEPEKNIPLALEKLTRHVDVQATSTFYRTKPLGKENQPVFYNGVWQIQTKIPPRELKFNVLRRIEEQLGRVRTTDRYVPRPIDLDLILYGNALIDETDLCVPDRDITTRSFIAIPLLELAPEFIIPGSKERLSSLGIARAKGDMEVLVGVTETLRQRVAHADIA